MGVIWCLCYGEVCCSKISNVGSLLWVKETHHLAQPTWSVQTTLLPLCKSETAFNLAKGGGKKKIYIYILCLQMRVQAGLILCDLFFHNFTLAWLENLHHPSNLRTNFQFNAIWHRRSMAAFIFCRRLTESDVTLMPSVTYMDWLHWWYQHAAHVFSSSTTFGFLTNMSEKCKSTSPNAI